MIDKDMNYDNDNRKLHSDSLMITSINKYFIQTNTDLN